MTERGLELMIFHPSDELYGADRILLEMIAPLAKESFRVILPLDVHYLDAALSSSLRSDGVSYSFEHVPVLRRDFMKPRHLLRLLRDLWRSLSLLRRVCPSHVHLNTSAMLLLAWPAHLLRARTTLHVHEVWRPKERWLLSVLAFPCSAVICVSDATRSSLPRFLQKRAKVIYNGVPTPKKGQGPQGPADDTQVFLVASRWNAWKGHAPLFAAWQLVLNKEPHGRRLVVLGAAPVSGEAVDVPKMRAELSCPETVQIIGEVGNVGDYIMGCDCVIVPSVLPDPLPTIAIEAAALGRGVLATDIGGLPEIVAQGVSGILVPQNDPEALASAILTADEEQLRSMGKRARERYERLFSPERFQREVVAALDLPQIANGGHPRRE